MGNNGGGISTWACPVCGHHNKAAEIHTAARCASCSTTVKLYQRDWGIEHGRVMIPATPTPVLQLKGRVNGPAHLYIKGHELLGRMVCGVSVARPILPGSTDRACANCQRLTHDIFIKGGNNDSN